MNKLRDRTITREELSRYIKDVETSGADEFKEHDTTMRHLFLAYVRNMANDIIVRREM